MIDSYNVKMQDPGTGTWSDIFGQEGSFAVANEFIATVDINPGSTYKITVRAHNSHGLGPESDELTIVAAMGPETPDPHVTQIYNHFIRITWTAPYQNSAPISAYKVFILKDDGDFALDLIYCDGRDEPILSNLYCEIPMSALRLNPYYLNFDYDIKAKV